MRHSAVELAEHTHALNEMRQADLDDLVEMGVSGEAYVRAGCLGVQRIATTGRFYEPDPHGEIAFIQGVSSDDVGLVDLIAWRGGNPDQWWFRHGRAWALGETDICNARFWFKPLRLWRSPLTWLKGGCNGGCVLDDRAALFHLVDIPEIIAEDVAHGRHLKKLLTPPSPPTPNIVVPALTAVGAAA
jgi:hypothetical protein